MKRLSYCHRQYERSFIEVPGKHNNKVQGNIVAVPVTFTPPVDVPPEELQQGEEESGTMYCDSCASNHVSSRQEYIDCRLGGNQRSSHAVQRQIQRNDSEIWTCQRVRGAPSISASAVSVPHEKPDERSGTLRSRFLSHAFQSNTSTEEGTCRCFYDTLLHFQQKNASRVSMWSIRKTKSIPPSQERWVRVSSRPFRNHQA